MKTHYHSHLEMDPNITPASVIAIIPRTIPPPVPFQGWYCGTNKIKAPHRSSTDTPIYLESRSSDDNDDTRIAAALFGDHECEDD